MEVLNNTSLCEALVRCNDNKNYKAIIAFATLADAKDFARELFELHRDTSIPGIDRVFVGGIGGSRINFTNGSRIELITLTDNARGKKCNEVIYESGVDITDDRIRGLLQCMLVPYRCGAYESMDGRPLTDASRMIDGLRRYERYKEAAQRSEELDEFLGSFSITE